MVQVLGCTTFGFPWTCFLPENGEETETLPVRPGFRSDQGGQRNSLPTVWECWGGSCRESTVQVFGVHIGNMRHGRLLRPAKPWLRAGNPKHCWCDWALREAAFLGHHVHRLEGGLQGQLLYCGSRQHCWDGADQHHILNQLKTFWLL